jgi:hypothetical protein
MFIGRHWVYSGGGAGIGGAESRFRRPRPRRRKEVRAGALADRQVAGVLPGAGMREQVYTGLQTGESVYVRFGPKCFDPSICLRTSEAVFVNF